MPPMQMPTFKTQKSFQSGESARVRFSLQGNLVPGTYYLNVGVTKEGLEKEEMLHRRVDVLIFRVVSAHPYSSNGFANLFGNVEVKKSDSNRGGNAEKWVNIFL